ALDAGVEALAEVEGDALRGALGEVTLREVEEAPDERDAEEPADGAEDDRPAALREALVDRDADELRRGEVRDPDAEEGEDRPDGLSAVVPEVREGAPDGFQR